MEKEDKDYFELGNGYLSGSKIKDYKKDPEYFYKKNISGEIEKDITDALVIGSAVDFWLSEGKEAFDDRFIVFAKGTKRNKKDPDYQYHLTETLYNQVAEMCIKAEKQPVHKDLREKYQSQIILKAKMDIGPHFQYLTGIPDWFRIMDKTCIIVDLKTAQNANKFKYHYHCLDYGYYLQQAVYQILIKEIYPEVEEFISKHWVIEKDTDKIYNSYIFNLSQMRIEQEKEDVFSIIETIKNDKLFAPRLATWESAEDIGLTAEEIQEGMSF